MSNGTLHVMLNGTLYVIHVMHNGTLYVMHNGTACNA